MNRALIGRPRAGVAWFMQRRPKVNAGNRTALCRRYAADIAWETEVWIVATPDHMIHFNGPQKIAIIELACNWSDHPTGDGG
jgi:hypothetical protein